MTEEDKVKLMQRIAKKMFKRINNVVQTEFKEPLTMCDFQNIAFSSMVYVVSNFLMLMNFKTEKATGIGFNVEQATIKFAESLLEGVQKIQEEQRKQKAVLQ